MAEYRANLPLPLSPARERLKAAAKAARMPLKEISLAIGRNHSYLQQFLARASPKVLPEGEREAIAALLGIPADDLRDTDRPRPGLIGPPTIPAVPARPAARRLPLITEGQEDRPHEFITLADMTGGEPSAQACVLRLTKGFGIFQPRALLLLDPSASVRMGDLAALIEEGRFRAAGLAAPHPENRPALYLSDGRTLEGITTDAALWRIEAIRPA